MPTTPPAPIELAARHTLALMLSQAFVDPARAPGRSDGETYAPLLREIWGVLCVDYERHHHDSELGLGERTPEPAQVEALLDWMALPADQQVAAHQAAFGLLTSRECPPYETEYCHWKDPTYRAHQLADVAGFYRAFHHETSQAHPERADHIVLELEFVSLLHRKQQSAIERQQSDAQEVCRSALHAFLTDHVVWWMPTFGQAMVRRIDRLLETAPEDVASGLHTLRGLGSLLCAWVAVERTRCGIEPARDIIAPLVDCETPGEPMTCGACDHACG